MKVFIIKEERHGDIGVAISEKAAKQFMLRDGWVSCCSDIWTRNGQCKTLYQLFGNNWQEGFMGLNRDDLDAMGFCLWEMEVEEEKE